MAKIKIDKLRGISVLPKPLKLEVERNGVRESIDIDIYPFTVEEKASMKIKSEDLDKMDKNDINYNKTLENNMYETVFMVLQKSVEGITIDDVKTFPNEWLENIIKLALSHEGVTEEQFNELKKNEKLTK